MIIGEYLDDEDKARAERLREEEEGMAEVIKENIGKVLLDVLMKKRSSDGDVKREQLSHTLSFSALTARTNLFLDKVCTMLLH